MNVKIYNSNWNAQRTQVNDYKVKAKCILRLFYLSTTKAILPL